MMGSLSRTLQEQVLAEGEADLEYWGQGSPRLIGGWLAVRVQRCRRARQQSKMTVLAWYFVRFHSCFVEYWMIHKCLRLRKIFYQYIKLTTSTPIGVEILDVSIQLCSRKVKLPCERVDGLDSHWALFFFCLCICLPVSIISSGKPLYLHEHPLCTTSMGSFVIHLQNVPMLIHLVLPNLGASHSAIGIYSLVDLALPCYFFLLLGTPKPRLAK